MMHKHAIEEDERLKRNCWIRSILWSNIWACVIAITYIGLRIFAFSVSYESEWIEILKDSRMNRAAWIAIYVGYFPQLLYSIFAGNRKEEALRLLALLCQLFVFSTVFVLAILWSPAPY